MKKLISLMLALIMVFSLATVASAETTVDTSKWVSAENKTDYELEKVYTVTGNNGTELIVPQEDIEFIVTANTAGAPAITVDTINAGDLTMNDDGNITAKTTINVPSYSSVGVYEYSVTEKAGSAKAATYAKNTVTFSVLVTYDYENECLKSELILTSGEESNKDDSFENKYELGHLAVTKDVKGNLGDQFVGFDMTVTLTSDKAVKSTITVTDGNGDAGTTSAIAPSDWTESNGSYTATAYIKVTHGETVTLYNIPKDVSYAVVEDGKHLVGDDGFNVNSAKDTDYTATYSGEKGTIKTNETVSAKVTNEKKTDVKTGIVTDSAPYVILIAVCAVAAVAFVLKRRNAVEF